MFYLLCNKHKRLIYTNIDAILYFTNKKFFVQTKSSLDNDSKEKEDSIGLKTFKSLAVIPIYSSVNVFLSNEDNPSILCKESFEKILFFKPKLFLFYFKLNKLNIIYL